MCRGIKDFELTNLAWEDCIQNKFLFPLGNHSASSQLCCLVIAGLSCISRIVKISFEPGEFSVLDIEIKGPL